MALFQRKKTNTPPSSTPGELGQSLNAALCKLSSALSRCEQRMTLQQKKAAITLLCLPFIVASMMTLYQGLFVHNADRPAFLAPQPIARPVVPHLPDSLLRRHRLTGPPTSPKFPADSITK